MIFHIKELAMRFDGDPLVADCEDNFFLILPRRRVLPKYVLASDDDVIALLSDPSATTKRQHCDHQKKSVRRGHVDGMARVDPGKHTAEGCFAHGSNY